MSFPSGGENVDIQKGTSNKESGKLISADIKLTSEQQIVYIINNANLYK